MTLPAGEPVQSGQLIVVNGTSSAGKTSFCRALQAALNEPYLLMGHDLMWMTGPARYGPFQPQEREGVWYETAAGPGLQVTHVGIGPVGQQIVSGLHHAVAGLLISGNNVIVDALFLERGWFKEAARLWQPFQPLLVTLRPPLEVSEQWEAEREATQAGRPTGLARLLYEAVHAHGEGDLVIDTSQGSPDECAQRVVAWMQQGNARQGLRTDAEVA